MYYSKIASILLLLIFEVLLLPDVLAGANEKKWNKVYSKEDYISDIEQVAQIIEENHPRAFAHISEAEFNQLITEIKLEITNSTTYSEFLWKIDKIVASIGCGHSSLGYFNQENDVLPDNLRFPLDVRLVDSRLYVIDPLSNSNKIMIGDEIMSINGIETSLVIENIYKHISSDGGNLAYKKQLLNDYFTAYMSYNFDLTEVYTVIIKGNSTPQNLVPLKSFRYKPLIHPKAKCRKNLCLDFNQDKSIAILTVRSFSYYGETISEFEEFITNSFSEISENSKDLIIDVRANNGGSSIAAATLLTRISESPFRYFKKETGYLTHEIKPDTARFFGNVYVLADGGGLSTTGHFLSLIKHYELATIIGEESGATFSVNDASKDHTLNKTNIKLRMATEVFSTVAEELPLHRGVLPDHHISKPLQDYINGTDEIMDYAISLIKNEH